MASQVALPPSRYAATPGAQAAEGWSLTRITGPSRLFGANGITAGADGRLYIAQVAGSQVSALDPDTGAVETVSPIGGPIVAPDDLVFDDAGNMYLTEITEGRVARRSASGKVDILRDDIPVANPITWHQGKLIAGECRMGARIMEMPLDGSEPRVILEDVPMANAFQVGPDGKLYFPVMATNEIWRVDLAGGAPEVVAGDLGVPDSVKFDSKGRIVTTQVASGQVIRIDPVAGTREVLADLGPGLDNCTFIGDRLFVTSIPGEVTEILGPGQTRPIIPRGLQWPLGLAVDGAGTLFVADGGFSYTRGASGNLETACMLFTMGGPGYVRGVCPGSKPGEWVVTTGLGSVGIWRAGEETEWLAHGFDQLMGVVRSEQGSVIFAESASGTVHVAHGGETRVAMEGLDRPMGVVLAGDTVFVCEEGAGAITGISKAQGKFAVADGLGKVQGLCMSGGTLYAVDVAGKRVIAVDPSSGDVTVIASGLPVGAPEGMTIPFLGPIGDMAGPMVNFAGIAAGADGTLYVAGDAEGSVLELRPL